jgi:hypothetical protein
VSHIALEGRAAGRLSTGRIMVLKTPTLSPLRPSGAEGDESSLPIRGQTCWSFHCKRQYNLSGGGKSSLDLLQSKERGCHSLKQWAVSFPDATLYKWLLSSCISSISCFSTYTSHFTSHTFLTAILIMFNNLDNASIPQIDAIFGRAPSGAGPLNSQTYNSASLMPYTLDLDQDHLKYLKAEAKRLHCGEAGEDLTEAHVKSFYTRNTGAE